MIFNIVRLPMGVGIKFRFSVDEKPVVVFAGVELHLALPGSVGHSFHGMRIWIPIIEITAQKYGFRVGSVAGEVYRIDGLLCREVLWPARSGNGCGMHCSTQFVAEETPTTQEKR
mgnify:CR=1 FL=1